MDSLFLAFLAIFTLGTLAPAPTRAEEGQETLDVDAAPPAPQPEPVNGAVESPAEIAAGCAGNPDCVSTYGEHRKLASVEWSPAAYADFIARYDQISQGYTADVVNAKGKTVKKQVEGNHSGVYSVSAKDSPVRIAKDAKEWASWGNDYPAHMRPGDSSWKFQNEELHAQLAGFIAGRKQAQAWFEELRGARVDPGTFNKMCGRKVDHMFPGQMGNFKFAIRDVVYIYLGKEPRKFLTDKFYFLKEVKDGKAGKEKAADLQAKSDHFVNKDVPGRMLYKADLQGHFDAQKKEFKNELKTAKAAMKAPSLTFDGEQVALPVVSADANAAAPKPVESFLKPSETAAERAKRLSQEYRDRPQSGLKLGEVPPPGSNGPCKKDFDLKGKECVESNVDQGVTIVRSYDPKAIAADGKSFVHEVYTSKEGVKEFDIYYNYPKADAEALKAKSPGALGPYCNREGTLCQLNVPVKAGGSAAVTDPAQGPCKKDFDLKDEKCVQSEVKDGDQIVRTYVSGSIAPDGRSVVHEVHTTKDGVKEFDIYYNYPKDVADKMKAKVPEAVGPVCNPEGTLCQLNVPVGVPPRAAPVVAALQPNVTYVQSPKIVFGTEPHKRTFDMATGYDPDHTGEKLIRFGDLADGGHVLVAEPKSQTSSRYLTVFDADGNQRFRARIDMAGGYPKTVRWCANDCLSVEKAFRTLTVFDAGKDSKYDDEQFAMTLGWAASFQIEGDDGGKHRLFTHFHDDEQHPQSDDVAIGLLSGNWRGTMSEK